MDDFENSAITELEINDIWWPKQPMRPSKAGVSTVSLDSSYIPKIAKQLSVVIDDNNFGKPCFAAVPSNSWACSSFVLSNVSNKWIIPVWSLTPDPKKILSIPVYSPLVLDNQSLYSILQ